MSVTQVCKGSMRVSESQRSDERVDVGICNTKVSKMVVWPKTSKPSTTHTAPHPEPTDRSVISTTKLEILQHGIP